MDPMDTIHTCRRFVASILDASRRRDPAASRRIADDLRSAPPEVGYAAPVAALRASYGEDEIPTDLSRWIEAYFIPVAREALLDRTEGRR